MLTPDNSIDEFNTLTTKRIFNRNHPKGYWDFSSIMMYGPTEPDDSLDLLVEPFYEAEEWGDVVTYRAAKVAQIADDDKTSFIRLWVKDPFSDGEAYLAIDMVSDYWGDGGSNKFVNNINERIHNTQWIRQYQKRSDEIDRWLWTDLYDMGHNCTHNHRNDGDYVDL